MFFIKIRTLFHWFFSKWLVFADSEHWLLCVVNMNETSFRINLFGKCSNVTIRKTEQKPLCKSPIPEDYLYHKQRQHHTDKDYGTEFVTKKRKGKKKKPKKRVKHIGIMISFVYFWGAAQTKQYYLSLRSLPLVVETVLFETRNHPSFLCEVFCCWLLACFLSGKRGYLEILFLLHLGGFLRRMKRR